MTLGRPRCPCPATSPRLDESARRVRTRRRYENHVAVRREFARPHHGPGLPGHLLEFGVGNGAHPDALGPEGHVPSSGVNWIPACRSVTTARARPAPLWCLAAPRSDRACSWTPG